MGVFAGRTALRGGLLFCRCNNTPPPNFNLSLRVLRFSGFCELRRPERVTENHINSVLRLVLRIDDMDHLGAVVVVALKKRYGVA